MAKTSNVFARVEPQIKEQAENILEQFGIPMSNAISIFLRQVVLQRGIPFDMKLPKYQVLDIGALSEEQFNAEMEKGFQYLDSGRVVSAQTSDEKMRQE